MTIIKTSGKSQSDSDHEQGLSEPAQAIKRPPTAGNSSKKKALTLSEV